MQRGAGVGAAPFRQPLSLSATEFVYCHSKRRRRLAQELEWVRAGAKARQAKSRSRLQRYEQLAAEAQRPPGRVVLVRGNFEGYQNNKLERLGIEATRPHRVTYRKLTRE